MKFGMQVLAGCCALSACSRQAVCETKKPVPTTAECTSQTRDCATRTRGNCEAGPRTPGMHGYMVEAGDHAIAVAVLFEARRRTLPIMRTRPLDCALRDLWVDGCSSEENIPPRVKSGDLTVLDALPDTEVNWIGCDRVMLKGEVVLRFHNNQWTPAPP